MCTDFVALLMSFSVLLCFLVTALPFCSTYLSNEVRYECGPHGKFEYCIDGIPGCVIGCHCHPGYYFDTDSKICEPNVKLAHGFRRHYLPEPTRGYDLPGIIPTVTEAVTTTNNLDDKVDEMPKDTDELGNWLYNQFFKTIESQVINNSNNTKPNSKEKPPTRRKGDDSGPMFNKSKRRARKSMRGGRKKKHMKVHGLRRKLLRITEDDSLFDSESGSDSSDSSDSSGTDSSSDGSSDTTDGKKESSSGKDDDKDHGHKKVIIFNRRPKPPLPSFIFLPGMDTPYYPPIGLLPPPPMPMYPMIPVPPMAPPMFPPFPGGNGSASSTPPPASQPTTETGQDTSTTVPSTTSEDPVTTAPDPLRHSDRRSRLDKHRRRPIQEQFIARASEPGKQGKLKRGPRNKLMQKLLREKMKEKRRNTVSPTDIDSLDEFQDEDLPNLDDIPDLSETFLRPKKTPKKKSEDHNIPKLEDVDFKYLSELIHRVNQSDARSKLGPLPFNLNNDLKELQKLKAQQTRRNFDAYNLEPINVQLETNLHRTLYKQGSDDTYYSNLGRQIASMIRNADSKIEHQLNKEQEPTNHQVPFHSVLNENSYAPRPYWERSVRSPLRQIGPFTNYLDESRTLRHSNEKSLLNLENEVEVFASTHPPLSLQDLENILNTMQKVHIHFRQPVTSTTQSNVSLNVNLLPNFIRPDYTYRRLFDEPEKVEYVTKHYQTLLPPSAFVELHPGNVTNTSVFHEPDRNYNVPFSDYWMYNNKPEPLQSTPKPKPKPVLVAQTNKPVMRDSQIYNRNRIRRPSVGVVRHRNNVPTKPRGEYRQFLKNMPLIKQTTPKTREPKVVNYNSLNYFSGDKHYMFEAASYPLLSPFKTQISKKYGEPSYFHHQSHHFEYFD